MAKSYRYDPWRFLKIGFATLCGVAVISTLVYYALGIYYDAHWSLFECLFMVVMTMSTLGNDVLHLEGRPLAEAHTMFLALVGIGIPAFMISMVTALIVDGVVGDTVRRRRMQQEIAKLSGHIIVCGAGGTGEHCIQEL